MKQCTHCKEIKELSEFSRRKNRNNNPHSWCKACNAWQSREWTKKNPELNRIKTAKHRRKYRYGITQDEYENMVVKQNGLCYICGDEPKRGLFVDHNHETDKVRNLLCDLCNKGLGLLRERVDIMERMILYVRKHS